VSDCGNSDDRGGFREGLRWSLVLLALFLAALAVALMEARWSASP
jgi:hypothetical protein